jgi:hypothetical protein
VCRHKLRDFTVLNESPIKTDQVEYEKLMSIQYVLQNIRVAVCVASGTLSWRDLNFKIQTQSPICFSLFNQAIMFVTLVPDHHTLQKNLSMPAASAAVWPCMIRPTIKSQTTFLVMETSGGCHQPGLALPSSHGCPRHFSAEVPLSLDTVPNSLSSSPPQSVLAASQFVKHSRS